MDQQNKITVTLDGVSIEKWDRESLVKIRTERDGRIELSYLASIDPHTLKHAPFALELCRIRYEEGVKSALSKALLICAEEHVPMPRWLRTAYMLAHCRIQEGGAKSWDEELDLPHKGKHQNAVQKRAKLTLPVYWAVIHASQKGAPIDPALFDSIGKSFSISGSTAKNYYYTYRNERSIISDIESPSVLAALEDRGIYTPDD